MLRKVTDLPCRVENGNLVELHDHLSRIVILIDGDQFIGLTIRIKLGCKEVREEILAKERAICGTTQRPIENPLFVADLHAERDRRVLRGVAWRDALSDSPTVRRRHVSPL